ncbi:hypothetical protein GCM10017161_04770 [Thalassotalea marina]|uniref:Aminoglycoside phosphotransferase domain-containing protein n=2 Tax=Thalassotalea marina TaxID=1673741 RepID=A0A919BDC1_9GAMM|nr:hypothetical protein GCM10017161_04770 [Thalassotalea marina]
MFGEHKLTRHNSGANSQGFKLETKESIYFLKQYPNDSRQIIRMERERQFIEHCCALNIKYVPNIHFVFEQYGCILFDWIEHEQRIIEQNDFVESAVAFVKNINQSDNNRLQYASEHAYTIMEFEKIVNVRLDALKPLTKNFRIAQQLIFDIEFTYTKLCKQKSVLEELTYLDFVSPSDFGLHNALLSNGQIVFIDFEYAGKDSAWKLVSDFFSQPENLIEAKYISHFVALLGRNTFRLNQRAFEHVYRLTLLKWALLILKHSFVVQGETIVIDEVKFFKAKDYFDAIPGRYEQVGKALEKELAR